MKKLKTFYLSLVVSVLMPLCSYASSVDSIVQKMAGGKTSEAVKAHLNFDGVTIYVLIASAFISFGLLGLASEMGKAFGGMELGGPVGNAMQKKTMQTAAVASKAIGMGKKTAGAIGSLIKSSGDAKSAEGAGNTSAPSAGANNYQGGQDGQNGQNGQDGQNGQNGQNGQDGQSGQDGQNAAGNDTQQGSDAGTGTGTASGTDTGSGSSSGTATGASSSGSAGDGDAIADVGSSPYSYNKDIGDVANAVFTAGAGSKTADTAKSNLKVNPGTAQNASTISVQGKDFESNNETAQKDEKKQPQFPKRYDNLAVNNKLGSKVNDINISVGSKKKS